MSAYAHVLEHGHLARLGDDPPPWRYEGWLKVTTQNAEFELRAQEQLPAEMRDGLRAKFGVGKLRAQYPHAETFFAGRLQAPPQRWAYFQDTFENDRLPEAALPRTYYDQSYSEPVSKELQKWMSVINGRYGHWGQLRYLMEWMGFGFGICPYPEGLDEDSARRLYETVDTTVLLLHPCDILGSIMSENLSSGWNPNAFFPTPLSVVHCMTEILMHGLEKKKIDQRFQTVLDPCVGTGRMLMAAGNYSMRLYGQDIDPLMVLATKLNFAVHCPWGLHQFPDAWWEREAERLGRTTNGKLLEEPSEPTAIPLDRSVRDRVAAMNVRRTTMDEAEALSSAAGHDVVEAARKRTATVGGAEVQLYLPGFWKERDEHRLE